MTKLKTGYGVGGRERDPQVDSQLRLWTLGIFRRPFFNHQKDKNSQNDQNELVVSGFGESV